MQFRGEKGSVWNLAVRRYSTIIHDLDFMEFKQIQTFRLRQICLYSYLGLKKLMT